MLLPGDHVKLRNDTRQRTGVVVANVDDAHAPEGASGEPGVQVLLGGELIQWIRCSELIRL